MKKRTQWCVFAMGFAVVIVCGIVFLRSDNFADLKYPPEERACRKFLRTETVDYQPDVPLAEIKEVQLVGIVSTFSKKQRKEIEPGDSRIIGKTMCAGDLAVLATLPNLETLNIAYYQNFDDELMASLPALPRLKSLGLYLTSVTEKSFPVIAAMKQLESLNMTRGAGYHDAQERKSMDWIPDEHWTDQTLEQLSTCTSVKRITLLGPSTITDDGLKHLEKLSNLEGLRLDAPQITMNGARYLQTLPNLKDAWIDGVDKSQSYTHHTLENGEQTIHYREQGVSLSR